MLRRLLAVAVALFSLNAAAQSYPNPVLAPATGGVIARTLTINAPAGQTVAGTPTSCSTTQGHQLRYYAAGSIWYTDY